MAMNKKGQAALVGLMVGVMIFMIGLALAHPLKVVLEDVMSSSQMDCANSSISDGAKLTCLGVDLVLPYFIITIFAVAGAWITAKFV